MSTAKVPPLPALRFATRRAFDVWLAKNHETAGVWIEFAKAAAKSPLGVRSITYAEAVEVALTWGWIDGQVKRIDDSWYAQRFTPRARASIWSKINCAKALALVADGKMKPSGLAEIERAQKDGRWARAYDAPSTSTVPDDLAAALAKRPRAAAFFATLDSRNRYAILHRLQTAKTPETRARRLATFVEMLVRGEKIYAERP